MNPQDPNLRGRLSAEKLALLEQRLRGEPSRFARPASISRRAPSESAPLSFAQQRLWFLDHLTPGSPFYNIFQSVRFFFPVNAAVLERSIHEIVRRHEIFRTRFEMRAGELVQVIEGTGKVSLQVVDLRRSDPADREAEAHRLATEEARLPFELSVCPLLRAVLLQMGDAESLLLISMHHIVSDGWSMGIFFRELSALYEAFSLGRSSPLPGLPIQYADFAVWQRAHIRGAVKERELSYWRRQLDGAPALQLPTDRPRAAVQSFRGAYRTRELSGPLSSALQALSRREGVTLFMTMLAAFKTLLHRYSGQTDLVVGSPIAGRNRTEIEPLIGFFVNTLVMRTQLTGDLSFRELLRRVQRTALEAYSHQELPFEMLVEELHPERDLSRNPLFQAVVQVLSATGGGDTKEATDRQPEVAVGTAKFDLTLTVSDAAGTLTASVEYNTDLFDDGTVECLLDHFQALLASIVVDPEARLNDLPLLDAEHRRRVLEAWNATDCEYPRSRGLHRLFEEQVATNPDAPAVTLRDETLSYLELNGRANRIANHLLSRGLAPEEPVGLLLERSPEMIVATLGVLKAGGSYLPLDTSHPKQRLATLLATAGGRFVIGSETSRELLPEGMPAVTYLDLAAPEIARESPADPDAGDDGERLAVVMYTSGSTGTPKPIAIPHRAVTRLAIGADYIAIRPGDRVTHASNCSFDAATFEIWGALLNGAELVVVPRELTLAYREYARFIQEQRIDVLFATTALFNQLAQHAPQALRTVREVMFGGEAAEPRWVRAVLEGGAPDRLLHMYGPAESTTYATWHLVTEVPRGSTTVPIGRPIANTRVYLLDERLQPVPVGMPGELYIGGDGLARGYLDEPAMTAERFVPDPFACSPGARLYCTGDRARYRADGSLEFLGRCDEQVKLRGFRIEPGEIQRVIEAQEEVEAALVMLREDRPGHPRLVAYLVARAGATASATSLRAHLRERLPEYMVPSALLFIDALPLTPNGKIDREALPAPADDPAGDQNTFVAPTTSQEQRIAGIWRDELGREQVGVNDNFFDLGGHSLMMARVHNRLQENGGPTPSMIDLFQFPTIRSLARHLDTLESPLQTEPSEDLPRRMQVQERVALQRQAMQKRAARVRVPRPVKGSEP